MIMWNRLRYTIWAPAYDALVGTVGFAAARRLSIDRLKLAPSDRVLIVGAGTGLDLDFLPSNVPVTAIDVTPAMLKHLERQAAGAGQPVTTRIMDARQLCSARTRSCASFDVRRERQRAGCRHRCPQLGP
jgi:SAM-dependent methyltransferase